MMSSAFDLKVHQYYNKTGLDPWRNIHTEEKDRIWIMS